MSQLAQLKINLPEELQNLLQTKASKFGIPLTQYVKHLIIKDVEDEEYPTFEASESTIKAAKKALKEKNKAITITDLHEYFKSL